MGITAPVRNLQATEPGRISLVIPTFERPGFLEECIRSAVYQAERPSRIEVCLRLTVGDDATLAMLGHLSTSPIVGSLGGWSGTLGEYGIAVRSISGEATGYVRVHEFFTDAARLATGDWLVFLGDDCRIRTPAWDHMLGEWDASKIVFLNTVEERPHLYPKQILSRPAWEALGRTLPHRAIDTYLTEVFRRLWGPKWGIRDRGRVEIGITDEIITGGVLTDLEHFWRLVWEGARRVEAYYAEGAKREDQREGGGGGVSLGEPGGE